MLLSQIAGTFRKHRLDEELDEELKAHLDMLQERFIRRGMEQTEAFYAARRQFGGVTQVKQDLRERRALPLTGLALQEVERRAKVRRLDTALLFPRADGRQPIDIRYAWAQALQAAGITDCRFHDLRHSCASYLAMSGASLVEIAAVLGHKTLQMVQRYAHLSDAHTAGVVARMTAAIFEDGRRPG